jgi:hypothetical protein
LLLKTKLQFNPDYYRITNLSNDEESKDEGYGLDANGAEKRERRPTQPKLEFPVRENAFSEKLLFAE